MEQQLKRGRPRITDEKERRCCAVSMKITRDFDSLARKAKTIKGVSVRQLFEMALKDFIRNDKELSHLLEN